LKKERELRVPLGDSKIMVSFCSVHVLYDPGGVCAVKKQILFLLVISLGRDWLAQSILEFSAMKKNLRIMSDMERVFWTISEDSRWVPLYFCFPLQVF